MASTMARANRFGSSTLVLVCGLAFACAAEPAETKAVAAQDGKAKAPVDAKPDAKVDAKPAAPAEGTAATEPAIAKSINAFAIDLHHELGKKPGNLFVSPASIALAFAMTHAGAKGATAEEIAKTFHWSDNAALHEGFAALLARWDNAPVGLDLEVANRLFGEKTVTFEPAFLTATKDVFAAPLEPLDFKGASGPARTHINDWVATQTHDKIRDLLPPAGVSSETKLVLVNAVYFKAKWLDPFTENQTADAKFEGGSGDAPVKMMTRIDHLQLAVAKDAGARVLELPYEGNQYSMVVVLPDDAKGLAKLEAALTADALQSWIDGAARTYVEVKLPRFKIEPGEAIALSSTLASLGMVTPFDASKADFTGMAAKDQGIVIAEAYHKAFIAVDEAGTEAAAATAVSMKGTGAAPSDPPVPFVADHPFLFLVRDMKTGAILFMGRLTDPKS
jgi:serpin B